MALPRRLPGAVEVAAYFAVCEALANLAKHSRATRASVRGRLLLSSPSGGPTLLRMEIPCRQTAPSG